MKIQLICINRERWPEPAPPVGLAWVAAALRRVGHEVRLLDLMYVEDTDAAIQEAIEDLHPDLVALSLRNVDTTWMHAPNWAIPEARRLTDVVRSLVDCPIVLGGAGPSLLVRETLRALELDIAVVGEGELVAPRLVEALGRGESLEGLPGVVHLGQPTVVTPPVHADIWDHFPPAHDLIDYRPYVADGGGCGVQTKRGCAFNCIYCNYPVLEGRTYRRRDPEQIADEIEGVIRDQGIVDFGFTNSVFTFPKAHAIAVSEAVARRDMGARWTAYVNPSDVDAELVDVMARSGCHAVELGADVADEKMLQRTQKGFGLGALERSVNLFHDRGVSVGIYVLFGGPGETRESAESSLEFLRRFPHAEAVIFSFGMRIYPGTELEQMALAEGKIAAGESLLEPRFYFSEHLTDQDVVELAEEIRRNDRWLAPGDLVDGDDPFLVWAVRKYGIRPIWRMAEKTARLRQRNRDKTRTALKSTRR